MGSPFQSFSFVGRVLDRAVATTFPGWAERRAKARASLNFIASIGNVISSGRTGTTNSGVAGKEGVSSATGTPTG